MEPDRRTFDVVLIDQDQEAVSPIGRFDVGKTHRLHAGNLAKFIKRFLPVSNGLFRSTPFRVTLRRHDRGALVVSNHSGFWHVGLLKISPTCWHWGSLKLSKIGSQNIFLRLDKQTDETQPPWQNRPGHTATIHRPPGRIAFPPDDQDQPARTRKHPKPSWLV